MTQCQIPTLARARGGGGGGCVGVQDVIDKCIKHRDP